MKILQFVPLLALLAASACTDDTLTSLQKEESLNDSKNEILPKKTTREQATNIAEIFSNSLGSVDNNLSNKSVSISQQITSESYYIDGNDTLLYAFNFGDKAGYVVLGGNLSKFPIVAQSDTGFVNLNSIDEDTPFGDFISQMAESIKSFEEEDTSSCDFWADVANPDYKYSVEIVNNGNTNKSRSTISKGWEHIFPSTGNQIGHRWYQGGEFDSAAKNGAHIGCPAVAIGMLLYDVHLRDAGSKQDTWPQFTWADTKSSKRASVSERFRQIADMIPNYNWGSGPNKASGASGDNIVAGLRALGFSNANISSFNLEKAHKEMTFTETDANTGKIKTYERGILMCGYSGSGGHIWFCDGYQEVKYKVTKKDKNGKVVSERTEYENQLFMNWGQKSAFPSYVVVENNTGLSGCAYRYSVKMITGLTKYSKINK